MAKDSENKCKICGATLMETMKGGSRELMNVSLPNAQTATHKINDRPKDKNTVGMG